MEPEKKEADQATDERVSKEALQKVARSIATLQAEALAQSAGAVDPMAVAEVVAKNTKAEIDATGNVKVAVLDPTTGEKLRNVNGTEMSVGQFIAQMKADPDHGYLFKDGAARKPKAKPSGGLETESNPWMPATWNLTDQGRLLRTEPVYAARLQAAAKGLRPENPWSKEGFNLTKQSQILRDDPALAVRMKAEVAPRERNPWKVGPEHNLTAQVLMIRSNPDKARRLQAEAEASNGPAPKKSYIFTPPPGSFKRSGIGI